MTASTIPEPPCGGHQALGCIIQGVGSSLTWLLGLLCASSPVLFQQDRLPAADPGRDNDVHAIYSRVNDHSPDQDKLYLVAPETSKVFIRATVVSKSRPTILPIFGKSVLISIAAKTPSTPFRSPCQRQSRMSSSIRTFRRN